MTTKKDIVRQIRIELNNGGIGAKLTLEGDIKIFNKEGVDLIGLLEIREKALAVAAGNLRVKLDALDWGTCKPSEIIAAYGTFFEELGDMLEGK